ncbi:DMT family transporter [Actinophytocola sp.]|uniref:DMT family transporter n=1 Tax=Actinophytocola sp. TaxID=1872138 RepID=UPI002D81130E|nr:DMT family transporter [Actinophytocola sp.]HET9141576.1 DMT family transporter [Actinophytocola sp.]
MRTCLSLVAVMAFWGSAFASSKLAVHAVPHEVAAFLRFGMGAAILLVVHAALGRDRPTARDAGVAAGLGLLGVLGYNVLFFLALTMAPAADGSVIVPVSAPVITVAVTALLGRVLPGACDRISGAGRRRARLVALVGTFSAQLPGHRKLTRRAALGLAAALAGATVFLLAIPAGGTHRLAGDLLFLGSAACWAGYTMLGAPVLERVPAFTVTTFASAAGALALGILAVPAFDDVAWSELDTGFWLNQAYLAALPTALAYVLYYWAVRRVGPATASSAMFLVPVFGLTCAWLLLGESITPVQAVGAALMLGGAWLATVAARRTRPILIVWQRLRSMNRSSVAATASEPSAPCPSSVPSPPSDR